MNRVLALVMGYYNEIVSEFEHSPQIFEPTFYESDVDGERVPIVDAE